MRRLHPSTPSSTRGVVNDALAISFLDATIASTFVARWCARHRGSRLSMEYIGSEMTSRHHGLERACIRRPDFWLSGRAQPSQHLPPAHRKPSKPALVGRRRVLVSPFFHHPSTMPLRGFAILSGPRRCPGKRCGDAMRGHRSITPEGIVKLTRAGCCPSTLPSLMEAR